jgi:hypothetical protein
MWRVAVQGRSLGRQEVQGAGHVKATRTAPKRAQICFRPAFNHAVFVHVAELQQLGAEPCPAGLARSVRCRTHRQSQLSRAALLPVVCPAPWSVRLALFACPA